VTVGEFLAHAAARLAGVSPTPRLDAEVLAMHVCGLSRSELITRADTELCGTAGPRLEQLLARRMKGEPVAYLTGHREFWSLDLVVTPAVLIPRPETELLVERALALVPPDAAWTIADLGTGSGAIACALATQRPRSRVIAIDASPDALAVAAENVRRLGLTNVELRHGEWCVPLGDTRCELIVSNPPYIADGDPHLAQGDVRFEPRAALVSGTDGLDAIRRIAEQARAYLRPGGWLLLEHGATQGEAVQRILAAQGLAVVGSQPDLAGHCRITEARTTRQ
jgi:release factor glutamine methyltransferase